MYLYFTDQDFIQFSLRSKMADEFMECSWNEDGVDIDQPDDDGVTCLMRAVKDTELCRVLIEHGANVDLQDNEGDTAVHYAIEFGERETVTLLLERGADPNIRNRRGDDALQAASLQGSLNMVQQLIAMLQPPISRQVESYQLVGVYYAELGQLEVAFQSWTDALHLEISSHCTNTSPPNPVYLCIQNANSLAELGALHQNQDIMHMYILMIRESILGPHHADTILGLLNRGVEYRTQGDHRRCIELWKYALQIQYSGVGMEHSNELQIMELFCELFGDLQDTVLQFDDIFEVLEVATYGFGVRTADSDENLDRKMIVTYMKQYILLLISIAFRLDFTDQQLFKFKSLVYHLIQLDSTSDHPFLHLAIDQYSGSSIVQLLLECGADINSVDVHNNTALHLCTEMLPPLEDDERQEMMKVIDLLISQSAHVDARNNLGDIAAKGLELKLFQHINLQCLAAAAIKHHRVPYQGCISDSLLSFVRMH